MENQHHNQQQKLQRQQGSQISPTLSQPEIKYENSCNCSNMVMDERDPERCAHCHDHKYPILSNELNSQGNPVNIEVRNDFDQIPIDVQMYMNHHMMNHQIQPPVREQPPPNTIWFYNRDEPYYEFTNFKEGFPIKAAIREPFPGSPPDIKSWATSEHLFQAAKFKNTRPEIADKIRRCRTARDALNMARKYQQYVDPSWQSINVKVMEWVVKNKFEQHPILAKRLLETGDQILVEHTEVDRFWGDGGDGSGRNMLGEVLMHVRKHLRDTPINNNGENSSLGGDTEANSIYSMSGPASSSTPSLPTSPMYVGNGNIHHVTKGQGSSQQSPIPPSPPPLPPRRPERRDLHKFQEIDTQIQQQQIHQQQILQQQQQIVQQLQIQQQIQQQQQEAALTHQYLQQMQPQPNVYIPTDDGSTYYVSAPPPYREYDNM